MPALTAFFIGCVVGALLLALGAALHMPGRRAEGPHLRAMGPYSDG